MKVKKIGIGSDYSGFRYKEEVKKLLTEAGYLVKDFGIYEEIPVKDYKFVEDLCLGIRAALCNDLFTARKSREHNQSNVLAFGARVIGIEVAKEIVNVWLETDFEGGRHIPRNDFITYLENKY